MSPHQRHKKKHTLKHTCGRKKSKGKFLLRFHDGFIYPTHVMVEADAERFLQITALHMTIDGGICSYHVMFPLCFIGLQYTFSHCFTKETAFVQPQTKLQAYSDASLLDRWPVIMPHQK